MYEDIKHIANVFRIKCGKYPKEELTPELIDTLFEEAFNEYCMMNKVNLMTEQILNAKNETVC